MERDIYVVLHIISCIKLNYFNLIVEVIKNFYENFKDIFDVCNGDDCNVINYSF